MPESSGSWKITVSNRVPATTVVNKGAELRPYAELRIETMDSEQDHTYHKLQVITLLKHDYANVISQPYFLIQTPEMKQNQDKRYHTLQVLSNTVSLKGDCPLQDYVILWVQVQGKEVSSRSIKDDGYEILQYEDEDVRSSSYNLRIILLLLYT